MVFSVGARRGDFWMAQNQQYIWYRNHRRFGGVIFIRFRLYNVKVLKPDRNYPAGGEEDPHDSVFYKQETLDEQELTG